MSHVSFTHSTTTVWHSCILVIYELFILIVRPNKKRFNSRNCLPRSEWTNQFLAQCQLKFPLGVHFIASTFIVGHVDNVSIDNRSLETKIKKITPRMIAPAGKLVFCWQKIKGINRFEMKVVPIGNKRLINTFILTWNSSQSRTNNAWVSFCGNKP